MTKGSWDILRESVSQELYVMDIHSQSGNLSSAEFVSDSIMKFIRIETFAWPRGCYEVCVFKYLCTFAVRVRSCHKEIGMILGMLFFFLISFY